VHSKEVSLEAWRSTPLKEKIKNTYSIHSTKGVQSQVLSWGIPVLAALRHHGCKFQIQHHFTQN